MRLPIFLAAIAFLVTLGSQAFAAAQAVPPATRPAVASWASPPAKPDTLICSWESGLEGWKVGEKNSRKVYVSPNGVTHGAQSLAVDILPGFQFGAAALACNRERGSELRGQMRRRHVAIDVTAPPDASDKPLGIGFALLGASDSKVIGSQAQTIPADGRPHTVVFDAIDWQMMSENPSDWFMLWISTTTAANAKTGTVYLDNLRILATNPIPADAEQDAARALVRQAYSADYKRTAAEDQERLAATLRTAAQAGDTRYTEKYALLTESCEIAARAGDVDSLFKSMDLLHEVFETAPPELPAKYLALAGQNVSPGDTDRLALLRRWMSLVWQRLAQQDVATAQRAITGMDGLTRSASGEVKSLILSRKREVREGIQLTEAAAMAAPKLRDNPDDPGANLAVGKHLCFVAGDWSTGRRFLAKGTGSPLQKAAANDIAVGQQADNIGAAEQPNGQFRLAQQWWDLGENEGALAQMQLRARAAQWYTRALPRLSGISKTIAEKRIPEAEASLEAAVFPVRTVRPAATRIDLLSRVDLERDAFSSRWRKEGGDTVCGFGSNAKLQLMYQPPEEYDLAVEFTPQYGERETYLYLWAGGRQFRAILSSRRPDSQSGFDTVSGKGNTDPANRASVPSGPLFPEGKRQSAVVQVRRDGLTLSVNNVQLLKYRTDYSDIRVDRHMLYEGTLGLGSWYTSVRFHRVELTEVSGLGREIAEPAPLNGPPRDAVRIGNRAMLLLPIQMDRRAADRWCRRNAGRLLTITNAQENEAAAKLLNGSKAAWLGAIASGKDKPFKWPDGSELQYANWAKDQPGKDSPPAAELRPDGSWHPIKDDAMRWVICEWPGK